MVSVDDTGSEEGVEDADWLPRTLEENTPPTSSDHPPPSLHKGWENSVLQSQGASQKIAGNHNGPNGLVLGLALGAVVGGALLLIIILVLIFKKCGVLKRKSLDDLDFGNARGSLTRSAPSTRSSSPVSTKRSSMTSQHSLSDRRAAFMRSLTADMIPDFEIPPERVQPPRSPSERQGPMTSLQFQHSIIDSLQPDLYSGYVETEQDAESIPAPSGNGRLWFSLVYDAAVQELTVNLIKAKYLKPRGKNKESRDPFVKVYLLPDERTCQESRVRKKTLAPKFNDTFRFQVPEGEITGRTLRLSVYDVDKKRVRHSLGHVLVPLGDVDLTRCDVMWRDLEAMSQNTAALGEVSLSLCYLPATEKLKVVILQARNLKKLEYDDNIATYVRVQLLHGRRLHKTKKTAHQKGTCDPVYNESFAFTLPFKSLDACSVVLTLLVSTSTRLGGHEEEYGGVTLGSFMHSRGEELMHWQEMLAQPGNTVRGWHMLSTAPKPQDPN